MVRATAELKPEEDAYRLSLLNTCAEAAVAYPLAQTFIDIVRQRKATQLEDWLAQAQASNVPELQRLATSLRHDYDAVRAALDLPWSNGQVEGQVNRLKLVKRLMYGRANFDLLRLRALWKPEARFHQK